MSVFKVNVIAVNPLEPARHTPPIEALVDTGSELTWLPGNLLSQAGVTPCRKLRFQTATNETVERDIGYAILQVDGFEAIDHVVFAQDGDMNLLGVRTLEGFSVTVDAIAHRFIVTPTLVACVAAP